MFTKTQKRGLSLVKYLTEVTSKVTSKFLAIFTPILVVTNICKKYVFWAIPSVWVLNLLSNGVPEELFSSVGNSVRFVNFAVVILKSIFSSNWKTNCKLQKQVDCNIYGFVQQDRWACSKNREDSDLSCTFREDVIFFIFEACPLFVTIRFIFVSKKSILNHCISEVDHEI